MKIVSYHDHGATLRVPRRHSVGQGIIDVRTAGDRHSFILNRCDGTYDQAKDFRETGTCLKWRSDQPFPSIFADDLSPAYTGLDIDHLQSQIIPQA